MSIRLMGPTDVLQEIPSDDPLVAYLLQISGGVAIDKLELDSQALRNLRATGVRLVVPIVTQGELYGLIALGPRLGGQDYSIGDRLFLNNLAAHAGSAFRVVQLETQKRAETEARERIEHELRRRTAPDGTVTILFSDIDNSTVLTERLGDQRWLVLLRTHNEIVRREIESHGGFEVNTWGDEFMVAFQSARRALSCAIDLQRAFAEHNERRPDEAILLQMGLHTGEPVKEGDDFYGRSVILASRITAQAEGGQILVSSLVKELTESGSDFWFVDVGEVELKGMTGLHRLYQVAW